MLVSLVPTVYTPCHVGALATVGAVVVSRWMVATASTPPFLSLWSNIVIVQTHFIVSLRSAFVSTVKNTREFLR